jgi:hypothetical protein
MSLSGDYSVEGVSRDDLKAIELSVMWHSTGKGDEDFAVHYFDRWDLTRVASHPTRYAKSFRTVLPSSPLSYNGVIVKIAWCVRLRVFLTKGKEVVTEEHFQLGNVPSGRAVLPVPARAKGDEAPESTDD